MEAVVKRWDQYLMIAWGVVGVPPLRCVMEAVVKRWDQYLMIAWEVVGHFGRGR
jgi:hypothetical protein